MRRMLSSRLVCLVLALVFSSLVCIPAVAQQGNSKDAIGIEVTSDNLVIEQGKTAEIIMRVYVVGGLRDPEPMVGFFDLTGKQLRYEEFVATLTTSLIEGGKAIRIVLTGVRTGTHIMRLIADDIAKDVRVEVTPRKTGALEDCYIDVIDPTGSSAWDDSDGEFWDVTGHKLRAGIYGTSSAYENSVIWRSSAKNVATIDKYGIITCKKAGKTTITASWKNSPFKRVVKLAVYPNEANWKFNYDDIDLSEDYCYTQGKRIYMNKGKLCIDFHFFNNTSRTIARVSPQEVYLTFDYEEDDYEYAGTYPAKLKSKIKPGKLGTVSVTMGRLDVSDVYLLWADAYAEGYVYHKDASSSLRDVVLNGSKVKGREGKVAAKMPVAVPLSEAARRYGLQKKLHR